jgi:caffeoyl-CoA O-methyltransferase
MTDITEPQIELYSERHTSPEPDLLVELAAATREFSRLHVMMVGQLEGRFLKMLVASVRATRVLEIGTFTGYSALSMAEALPADGRIISCEVSAEHAEMARSWIAKSPHADKIEVRLGPAIETVRALRGPFDFVFIDADKASYLDYYEAVLPMLAETGMIAVDNVFQSGRVLDASDPYPNAVAMREFNDFVVADPRVDCVMVPIRDGVTLIRKR